MTKSDGHWSRRAFLAGAARVGSATTALAWVAPKLSSTAFAADAVGSPPPGGRQPVETGVHPQGEPTGRPPAGNPTGSPNEAAAPAGAPPGRLPFTGSNTRPFVVAGTAAVVTGTVLTQASRQTLRPEEATQ